MRKPAPTSKATAKAPSPRKPVKKATKASTTTTTSTAATVSSVSEEVPTSSSYAPQLEDPALMSGWEQVLRERLMGTLGLPPQAAAGARAPASAPLGVAYPTDPMAAALATSQV